MKPRACSPTVCLPCPRIDEIVRLFAFLLLAVLLASVASASVPWLHVDGNQIKDTSGNAVTLRGVSLLPCEHNIECTTCGGRKPISEMLTWQADTARGWYSRVVRLGVTTAKVSDPEKCFATLIDPYVQMAVSKDLYVIVDLHLVADFDAGAGTGVKQQKVLDFWNYVAPRYANTPNVLFEVFNEGINPDSWSAWKDYIQPVVDSIRAVAPNNLILVGGPQWSTRVNPAVTEPVAGSNLVYVYHIYPNQGSATVANLDAKFGNAANTIPVMVTEFGWNEDANYSNNVTFGRTSTWGTPFRAYLDARPHISWTSYIFDNFWKPQFFDWDWNLLSGENQGAFMQQWFSEVRDSGQPQPAALTAAPITDGQINLSWPAATGAISYNVKRSSASGGPYTTIATAPGITYSDTGLAAETTYYYVVSANTSGGEGPDSAPASATTESPGAIPDVPLFLAANAGNGQVSLSWGPATGATSYNVKRSTARGGPFTTIATGVTATSYTDSAATNGQIYYYVVSAVGARESANSAPAGDLPSTVTAVLDNADASGVVITGNWLASSSSPGYYGTNYLHDNNTGSTGGKSVRFSPTLPVNGSYLVFARWVSASNRATNAAIEVNHAGGTASFSLKQWYNGGEWMPLGVFTFNAGTTGNVLIRNDGANGYVIADAVEFTLTDGTLTPPAAPGSLAASTVSSSEITLTWLDQSADEDGFRLDRATNASFSQNLVTTALGADVTSHAATGLAAGVTYYFRVRAFSIAGESANSSPASATTSESSAPAAPSALAATAVSSSEIDLTWTDLAANETGFELQRATDSAFTLNLTTTVLPADTTTHTATGLSASTTYYFRARAINGVGPSSWSSTANAKTQSPDGTATTTVTVNQRTGAGAWNSLGSFAFDVGTTGSVTIRTDGTNGYVVADAVRFSLSGQSDVIVDSENAGGIAIVGAWNDSVGSPGYWGTSYKHDQNAGKGTKSVTFTPNLPVAGDWTVSMRWTSDPNRASNIPVDIVHAAAAPVAATVTFDNLATTYDGSPRSVTVSTNPPGLPVEITYDGAASAPVYPGSYSVLATITDPNHTGSAAATMVVAISALVRHGPVLNETAGIDGSTQVLLAEDVTLNGESWMSGDLLIPGTPAITLNGNASYGALRDGEGSATPTAHRVTLNGDAILRYVVRRIDALAMPVVNPPIAPAGTRRVSLDSPNQSPGDFATLRDLTLNEGASSVAVPPGAYGEFTANGGCAFVLGVAGSAEPAAYDLQRLRLNGNARLELTGPVVLTLGSGLSLNTEAGVPGAPDSLTVRLAAGGLTLNGDSKLHGRVAAPNGPVTLNDRSQLLGAVSCDRLIINNDARLADPAAANPSQP